VLGGGDFKGDFESNLCEGECNRGGDRKKDLAGIRRLIMGGVLKKITKLPG